MNNLTVTIITLNEEKKLERCLESLEKLDAEIVVVDSGSTDKTLEIARRHGVCIYQRNFENFARQKNWAASKANNDWILSVDADEVIPDQLAREITEAIRDTDYAGFIMPRRNFILGGEIKHTRWSPDKHVWLWKKDLGKWEGEVHEEVVVKGKVGILTAAKLHYQQESIADFIAGNDLYASILAKKMVKDGKRFSLLRLFWDPLFEFNLRFFYKLGFLDGWRGFALSYLMAFYKITLWIKIWEQERI